MARNRKRAKERRARRPQAVSARTPGEQTDPLAPPNPLDHAAPDAAFAEAAELPPELRDGQALEDDTSEEDQAALEEDIEEFEAERTTLPERAAEGLAAATSTHPDAEVPHAAEHRAGSGNRLLTFLQGSWRELQRVQWPDRRQVMQATGVVIGFVIVAGVFLGVADYLSQHLVSLIVNGHF